MKAYSELYLDDAMRNLGEAMDYASNSCRIEMDEMDEFMNLFIKSGYAQQFGIGHPKYVSGLSGTELVMATLEKVGAEFDFLEPQVEYDYSPEYWCGWILAYYQWYTGRSFKEIQSYISMRDIEKLYPTLHEAHKNKFVEVVEKIIYKKQQK